jgi:hypothetical protein
MGRRNLTDSPHLIACGEVGWSHSRSAQRGWHRVALAAPAGGSTTNRFEQVHSSIAAMKEQPCHRSQVSITLH